MLKYSQYSQLNKLWKFMLIYRVEVLPYGHLKKFEGGMILNVTIQTVP